MSLFRAKTWWSTRFPDEEFDGACIRIGPLPTPDGPKTAIVIGSLQGMIRVLSPTANDYTVEDLLLEVDLNSPILGVEVGKFLPNVEGNGVAVLCPRKLVGECFAGGVGGRERNRRESG